jgi:hypothetical protein
MEVAIGTILLTVFFSVVVYSLLALVTRKGGCCAQTPDQKGDGARSSCCSNHEK